MRNQDGIRQLPAGELAFASEYNRSIDESWVKKLIAELDKPSQPRPTRAEGRAAGAAAAGTWVWLRSLRTRRPHGLHPPRRSSPRQGL